MLMLEKDYFWEKKLRLLFWHTLSCLDPLRDNLYHPLLGTPHIPLYFQIQLQVHLLNHILLHMHQPNLHGSSNEHTNMLANSC